MNTSFTTPHAAGTPPASNTLLRRTLGWTAWLACTAGGAFGGSLLADFALAGESTRSALSDSLYRVGFIGGGAVAGAGIGLALKHWLVQPTVTVRDGRSKRRLTASEVAAVLDQASELRFRLAEQERITIDVMNKNRTLAENAAEATTLAEDLSRELAETQTRLEATLEAANDAPGQHDPMMEMMRGYLAASQAQLAQAPVGATLALPDGFTAVKDEHGVLVALAVDGETIPLGVLRETARAASQVTITRRVDVSGRSTRYYDVEVDGAAVNEHALSEPEARLLRLRVASRLATA